MRIWIFNHYALPTSAAGGSRHHALARGLIERGHDVLLIASCRSYQTPERSRLSSKESYRVETVDGVPFLWIKTPGYRTNGAARLLNMIAYAWRCITGRSLRQLPVPDVIVGSSPHPFAALAACWIAKRLRVPFLVEVRDLWPQSLVDVGEVSHRHPLVVLLGVIERFLYRRAQAIVSLLPGAGEYVRSKIGSDSKVVWIPNGVDVSLVPWPNIAPINQTFTLMYAGAHGQANGLDTILDAAALLERDGLAEQFVIRLIGDGPMKASLMNRARELRLTSVLFEDAVPKVQVYDRLAEADAFLMVLKDSPVFRWGISPNKLFDYMATGRPVIFAVGTPYNPINASEGGLSIPPADPQSLAVAIRTLMAMPRAERLAMGARARSHVLESHGSLQLAAKLEAVLRQAIAIDARAGHVLEAAHQ